MNRVRGVRDRALKARGERGQSAILMVMVLSMFAVFGFAVVDVGLALGARRAAQTDADLIALAGAIELPDPDNDAAAAAAALASANEWADANDVDPSDVTIEVIDDCFSASDGAYTGVRVTVRDDPPAFFFGAFPGIPRLDVGATATACSGKAQQAIGFMPWVVERAGDCFTDEPVVAERTPILGSRCDLVVGGSGGESGDVGQLGLEPGGACADGNSSASVYEQNIIGGSSVLCSIGDSVNSNTGVNVGKTKSGLETRLAGEGACSANAVSFFADVQTQTATFNAAIEPDLSTPLPGGLDDFFEIWRPGLNYDPSDPAANLLHYDCDPTTEIEDTSPRNVLVVIVNDIAVDDGTGCQGGSGGTGDAHCYEVAGFARVYVEGCSTDSVGFSAFCDQSGAGGSFTIHARFVEAVGFYGGEIGLGGFGEIQTVLME